MHYVSTARIKSRKVAFEINLFQIYNRPKMATRAQAKPPWYLMGTLTSRRGREEMAGEVPRGEAKLVSRGEAKLVSTSPSFSRVILAIESNSFVRCFATILGWSPLERISRRSAEEAK